MGNMRRIGLFLLLCVWFNIQCLCTASLLQRSQYVRECAQGVLAGKLCSPPVHPASLIIREEAVGEQIQDETELKVHENSEHPTLIPDLSANSVPRAKSVISDKVNLHIMGFIERNIAAKYATKGYKNSFNEDSISQTLLTRRHKTHWRVLKRSIAKAFRYDQCASTWNPKRNDWQVCCLLLTHGRTVTFCGSNRALSVAVPCRRPKAGFDTLSKSAAILESTQVEYPPENKGNWGCSQRRKTSWLKGNTRKMYHASTRNLPNTARSGDLIVWEDDFFMEIIESHGGTEQTCWQLCNDSVYSYSGVCGLDCY